VCRQVRDDPYRRTWWMNTRNGPIMIKWFGDPHERDTVVNSLRLSHWASGQGAAIVQLQPLRDGSVCLDEEDGVLTVFEYVDGAVGVGDWKVFGRAVGRLHTLPVPEFAQRSYFCPRRSVPDAERQLNAFLAASPVGELAEYARRSLALLRELPPFAGFPLGILHTELGIAHTLTRATGEIAFLDTLDIGIGPLAMDLPPIFCEHLSHLNTEGKASHLNLRATKEFLEEYERFRPFTTQERQNMLAVHRAHHICHAARYLDQARRSGAQELLKRALNHFRWLDYVEEMVPRDLDPLLNAPAS